ncbi:MAG: hypothetical protein SOZ18_07325 [Phocaeicola sp.]|nr:hypothetical protein [Phocaeicola sp.]
MYTENELAELKQWFDTQENLPKELIISKAIRTTNLAETIKTLFIRAKEGLNNPNLTADYLLLQQIKEILSTQA